MWALLSVFLIVIVNLAESPSRLNFMLLVIFSPSEYSIEPSEVAEISDSSTFWILNIAVAAELENEEENENAKTMAIAAAISNRKRPLLRRRVYSTFLLPCLCLFYHGRV